jgi:hypothetical protein
MSSSSISDRTATEWWRTLGLRGPIGLPSGGNRLAGTEIASAILCQYHPIAFASREASVHGHQFTLEELAQKIEAAENEYARERNIERNHAAEARRAAGGQHIDAAFARSDADVVIAEGRWSGFTRARAISWCWNLFQYEPHGFVHPGSEVRIRAMHELEAGSIPSVFGYPERARELEGRGLTPQQYRGHKEALGEATFDQADVRT